jgi:predicted ATPase
MVSRVRSTFRSKMRTTWINIEPLNYVAVSSLVSRALHGTKEESAPLARLVHRVTLGNPFAIKNLLTQLVRQNFIHFHWDTNTWRLELEKQNQSWLSVM